MRPYRTADNRIDGVLMVFIDIHDLKTTQEALREHNSFSEAVMESSGALVMVTDLDGRVVAFNRACQIVSGRTREEIAGKVIWDSPLIPQDEVEGVRAVYRRLAGGRASIQHENHWVSKDGANRAPNQRSGTASKPDAIAGAGRGPDRRAGRGTRARRAGVA
jgi:PAS domain S-box-containing protein